MKLPWSKDKEDSDDVWKKPKAIIDKIFEQTKTRRDKIDQYVEMYRGNIWKKEELESWDSEAVYNLFFTTISSIAPLITDSKPELSVTPREPYMERVGRAYTSALKYVWDVLDMQDVLHKWELWTLMQGSGILKVFYCPAAKEIQVEHENFRNFFIAPGYEDIRKAPFCGTRKQRPLSWVKENFPDVELKGTFKGFSEDDNKASTYKYADVEGMESEYLFVRVYEVWSRDSAIITDEDGKEIPEFPHGQLMYFTDSELLGVEEVIDKHGLPPYIKIDDYVNPGMFNGLGEGDISYELTKEINLQLQKIFSASRREKNWTVDSQSGIDAADVKKNIHKGGNVWFIDKGYNKQNPIFEEVPLDPLVKEVYELLSLIPDINEDATGVTEITKGMVGKKERQSAVEVSVLAEASNTRVRQKIRNLESGIKQFGYLIIKLMQQHDTEDRWIHTDDDNEKVYQKFNTSVAGIKNMIAPERLRDKIGEKTDENWIENFKKMVGQDVAKMYDQDEYLRMQDYIEFVDSYELGEPADPVYFSFELEVGTGSTLPMDKQSKANLMLKLGQMKFADAEAVLDTLQVPGYKKIIKRMNDQKEAAMKARQQGGSK